VTSQALGKGKADRSTRLDTLFAAHARISDGARGRWETDELNHAIILGRNNLQRARKVDSGTAQPASPGTDFGRFNLPLWAELKARYPSRARTWNEKVDLVERGAQRHRAR
jgi:hypothetical protein